MFMPQRSKEGLKNFVKYSLSSDGCHGAASFDEPLDFADQPVRLASVARLPDRDSNDLLPDFGCHFCEFIDG